MPPPQLTNALRQEYAELFRTLVIRESRQAAVEQLVARAVANRQRYREAGAALGVPWFFVAAIHNLESSSRFDRHLHNGDPLTARTVNVPANRPTAGNPPFTWEESAADALGLKRLGQVGQWPIPVLLYQLERYNGFGYRMSHPEVLSPYLWSFSTHYSRGKFVADGEWSATAVSAQCGGAVLWRRMAELGHVRFDAQGLPLPEEMTALLTADAAPRVRYAPNLVSDEVKLLQEALNRFPDIFLRVDGKAGPRTSDAYRKITGQYLQGDPRLGVAAGGGS